MAAIFDSDLFGEPIETVTAASFSEVTYVLNFAEAQSRAGAYVMVMLSYEAAPAFDSALTTHKGNEFPLAWAAVFAHPANLATENGPSVNSSSLWTPSVQRNEYDRCVSRIHDLIAAGDTYQVNYSFPLTSSFSGDAFMWYRRLAQGGARYS